MAATKDKAATWIIQISSNPQVKLTVALYLCWVSVQEIFQLETGIFDSNWRHADHRVKGASGFLQKCVQPYFNISLKNIKDDKQIKTG